MTPRVAIAILAAWLLASCAVPGTTPGTPSGEAALAPSVEKELRSHVEALRAVRPATDARAAQRYDRQLQDAWKFFIENRKEVSLPLRRELTAELRKTARNDFILLDIGYFLYTHGEPADREIAKTALFALDPRADIVRFNQQELFRFAHAVASERDERVLPMIDTAFLRGRVAVRVPEANLTLDEISVCVFLYGAFGDGGEAHLRRLLADKAVARKVLDVLIWIGSPESNADAWSAMRSGDAETFVHGATFLMAMGGPQGRWLLLNANTRDLDARNREYYAKIRGAVDRTSFRELRRPFGDPEHMPGEELKRRLAAMNAGFARDVRVSPAAILDSELPREFLIEQLMRTRVVLLRRTAAEVPADVQRTNALINALRYREK